jgi:TRAP-type C4-dicarboxylate transport system permease small subunit
VNALQRISHALNKGCWFGAGFFLGLMLVVVLIQVFARYVVFSPPAWTEELARYCMVWAGLLGATVSYFEREDPVLISVPEKLPRHLVVLAELVQAAAVLGLIIPILWYSPVILEHHSMRLTESMKLNSAHVMFVVPLFAAIILFHLLARLLQLAVSGPLRN